MPGNSMPAGNNMSGGNNMAQTLANLMQNMGNFSSVFGNMGNINQNMGNNAQGNMSGNMNNGMGGNSMGNNMGNVGRNMGGMNGNHQMQAGMNQMQVGGASSSQSQSGSCSVLCCEIFPKENLCFMLSVNDNIFCYMSYVCLKIC